MSEIISKIKEWELVGRSGSLFPVDKKWEIVKGATGDKKYVIANGSEGEIDTYKDYHVMKNHTFDVVNGLKLAMKEVGARKGYIYLNSKYYHELKEIFLKEFEDNDNIEITEKKGGYLGGEETSLINSLEGNRVEPREKPPFPAVCGLQGYPTLIQNVETLYCVSRIHRGDYHNERFYSVQGDVPNKGVFIYDKNEPVKQILEKSGNLPDFDYFLQIGGGGGGKILLPDETDQPLPCLGSVIVYNRQTTDPCQLMRRWTEFFLYGNCDRCTPCREGVFRINEAVEQNRFSAIEDVFEVMKKTSLCPLGRVAVNPFEALLNKIIKPHNESKN